MYSELKLRLSIMQLGIISPLIVRPLGNGKYKIVDGVKRFDCSLCDELPCSYRSKGNWVTRNIKRTMLVK